MEFNRAKMRKNICDVMPSKFGGQILNLCWIAKTGDLIRVFVLDEPFFPRQPTVPNLYTVLSQVMPTVAYIQPRRPEPIAGKQHQQKRHSGKNCAPRRTFEKTFLGRAVH